jgi:hypothetical protein
MLAMQLAFSGDVKPEPKLAMVTEQRDGGSQKHSQTQMVSTT